MIESARGAPSNARRDRSALALLLLLLLLLVVCPYGLLVLISLGSGWSFPHLLPDRLDFAAWRHVLSDHDHLLMAIGTSLFMSLIVATLSVVAGLFMGRAVSRSRSILLQFLIYLPFVISPVVVGICLYDFFIRLRVLGNLAGVILLQTVFASSFAAVFFSEHWSSRSERLEQLVSNLGGNRRDVWRHAVLPRLSGLLAVCFIQSALYSWLDYGIVSVVGGGSVPSVTMRLFGYLREASVNQAALASLILLAPALLGFLLTSTINSLRLDERRQGLTR